MTMKIVALIPHGLEKEGVNEVVSLGGTAVKSSKGYLSFTADLACLYRLHLRSRLAFRFLREIARFSCNGPSTLYKQIQASFEWEEWLHPSRSFRVDVSGSTQGLSHSHFTALQVKNALVDLQRQRWGERSNIDLNKPDLCFHLHLNNGEAVLSLDGVSESLHRRGYRPAMGIAPLKENLAAGLILLSKWTESMPLVDPFCGTGTFLIEAVSISLGLSPGLTRDFLFPFWKDFDQLLWEQEKKSAIQVENFSKDLPTILGCEKNKKIADQAKQNIINAGLEKFIEIKNIDFLELNLPVENGYLICNPPYGKRLGEERELETLYKNFGQFCKNNASGWELWILNGNPNLSKFLRLKASSKHPVSNGGIDCRFINYCIR